MRPLASNLSGSLLSLQLQQQQGQQQQQQVPYGVGAVAAGRSAASSGGGIGVSRGGGALYSQPPRGKAGPGRRSSATGSGWYEHGVFDVAISLTELPPAPYELEYRERTVFTPTHPPPVDVPTSTKVPPVVLRVKARPKACAPPHPSTVRIRHEPEAATLLPPAPPAAPLPTATLPAAAPLPAKAATETAPAATAPAEIAAAAATEGEAATGGGETEAQDTGKEETFLARTSCGNDK
ncbi:hypothetical protein Esti_004189 [Eimeria stiedai]